MGLLTRLLRVSQQDRRYILTVDMCSYGDSPTPKAGQMIDK